MSRKARLLILAVSTPLVVFVMVGGLLGAVLPAPQNAVKDLRVFDDVLRLILGAYVEPPSIDKVMDGAMRGLADGLDPTTGSTVYLPPDEVRAFEARTALPPADIGVTVSRQFYLRIVGVRDGSPAARAGLRSGDFIRAIGEMATRDMSAYTGTRLLAGPAGSKVSLLIIRGNMADPHQVELTREVPATDRATSRRLPGGEAYVRVVSFGANAVPAIRSAVQATGTASSSGLILDLRDVGDGTPEDGIAAAKLFVAKGTLATREGSNLAADSGANGRPKGTITVRETPADKPAAATPTRKIEREVITAAPGDGAFTMPLVVIVSRGTGQAAEVLAAALVGNKRGRLVGEPTAGLASAQKLVKLPEGHGLLLTTSRYVQADGNPIHARGLRPEVLVEVPTATFDQPAPPADVLLERAVRELTQPTPIAAPAPPAAAGRSAAPPATTPNPPGQPPQQAPTTLPR